ncbi:MAG TPA: sigma-70 family RNA polymerase sigma factor [Micromonosporaceae bacterium]|nr:sigma-70 family RNA polymerase sigma factor [Micromonosporaceae bacterium]
MTSTTAGPVRSDSGKLESRLEEHRRELTGYCYRMLGSPFDAEDAVQETLTRAWRSYDRFDGRASLRSWLYRIATNVCIDSLNGRTRRALPMDLTAAAPPVAASLSAQLPEQRWVFPIPDDRAVPLHGDPADVAVARESIRLAFVAALQHLPPRQRAVLILREVLRWTAEEVAGLLETSVAAVNSALQRARAALAERDVAVGDAPVNDEQEDLLGRYVTAFERYDIEALVALLREDATQTMPPYEMWLRGAEDIGRWLLGPGAGCRGSRLIPVVANGTPAFGQYRVDPAGGHRAFSIQLITIDDGRISAFSHFLEPRLFPLFGLPLRLDD